MSRYIQESLHISSHNEKTLIGKLTTQTRRGLVLFGREIVKPTKQMRLAITPVHTGHESGIKTTASMQIGSLFSQSFLQLPDPDTRVTQVRINGSRAVIFIDSELNVHSRPVRRHRDIYRSEGSVYADQLVIPGEPMDLHLLLHSTNVSTLSSHFLREMPYGERELSSVPQTVRQTIGIVSSVIIYAQTKPLIKRVVHRLFRPQTR